ncbi:helix-turn-helix domain-containing protein [Nitrosococcus watsonii]|uniref:Transcriptional regulator, XRE family n=1 Tax=Nitrosococcus watsoni (strain C-113) TaxID=105559 RepID=D8KCC9_NITWC|nr:helix-turn-helix transcriptional regulator [Nitrosococcus watsonii]ADJ29870.1 transcriptional regulator, XRE family [Nitrosococcus watsonii C-113]
MGVGKNIKGLRIAAGLTQTQLAKKAHIDQSGLSKIERGENESVTLPMLRKIAKALDCSVVALLEDEDKGKKIRELP